MAQPTNAIAIIATEALGDDGFTNKEIPDSPVLNKGFGKQSYAYQHANYLHNNHGEWLKYINEEQIPDAELALQNQIDTINNTTIPDVDLNLQNQIDTINNTTIPDEATSRGNADTALQAQFDALNNRTLQDVTALRALGIEYTNENAFPIELVVSLEFPFQSNGAITVDGNVFFTGSLTPEASNQQIISITIQPDITYKVSAAAGTPIIKLWAELR